MFLIAISFFIDNSLSNTIENRRHSWYGGNSQMIDYRIYYNHEAQKPRKLSTKNAIEVSIKDFFDLLNDKEKARDVYLRLPLDLQDSCGDVAKEFSSLFTIEQCQDLFSIDEQTKILVPEEFIKETKTTIINNSNYDNILSEIKKDKSLFNKIVLWQYRELQHYTIYNRYSWTMIKDAIRYSEILERKLERNNFVKQLAELSRDFTLKKDELSAKAIQLNTPKELAYKDEDFTVILPTCPNDFIVEGQRQQNCVGGYVDAVTQNETWVVFIRKTNDVNTNYITCEINPHTKAIRQFLLSRNRRPSYGSIEEQIRTKYQEYLNSLKLS
jgi:hypothetical protein